MFFVRAHLGQSNKEIAPPYFAGILDKDHHAVKDKLQLMRLDYETIQEMLSLSAANNTNNVAWLC